nr:TetR family transcriptional regulator [Conexibacter arvalis]
MRAARAVIARDGARASVAAIAADAGVGVGSLYRRWPSKEKLFEHLLEVANEEWDRIAQEGLAHEDPWEGFAHYFAAAVGFGPGTLGPLAGTVELTPRAAAAARRSDEAVEAIIARARSAGELRADVTAVDVSLLIEQMSRSPLIEQLAQQGRDDLRDAAAHARRRLVAIVLDGLREPAATPLPGPRPAERLLTARWEMVEYRPAR